MTRLLEAARGPKYKAALAVAYGAGLRISEIVSLKVSDIDSKRMVIRVEQGKGRKDRYVMLSPHLLELLRTWWLVLRPRGYLFPGQDRISPLTQRQVRRACLEAARVAGITKRVSPHCLRHSFATHLLERKVDIRVIQVLLGHAKLDSTAIYTQVATKTIQEVTSPLEHLIPRTQGTGAKLPKPVERAQSRRQVAPTRQTRLKTSSKPMKRTKIRKASKAPEQAQEVYLIRGVSAASSAGGRGRFPRARTYVAQSQRRSREPRTIKSDVGDRELPHGDSRRPCRALRRLRTYTHRLQFLPYGQVP